MEHSTKMLLKLSLCFAGIFVSYMCNGVAVETITNIFGEKMYTLYFSLVLVPSLFNTVFARTALFIKSYLYNETPLLLPVKSIEKKTCDIPKKFYFICSVLFMGSMLCANASLAHINYPTQLVTKSSKPIAILIFSFLVHRKLLYSNYRMISVTCIVTSICWFTYQQQSLTQLKSDADHNNGTFGLLLVCMSLLFDGMLATTQESMKTKYTISTYEMMFYINLYSSIMLLTGVIVKGEMKPFVDFAILKPEIIFYLIILGVSGAVGSNFIYYTVVEFGPLTCSVVTTSRKFFNVLLSIVLFSHVMTFKLWLSVCCVFMSLFFDIWSQYRYS